MKLNWSSLWPQCPVFMGTKWMTIAPSTAHHCTCTQCIKSMTICECSSCACFENVFVWKCNILLYVQCWASTIWLFITYIQRQSEFCCMHMPQWCIARNSSSNSTRPHYGLGDQTWRLEIDLYRTHAVTDLVVFVLNIVVLG